MENLDIEKLSRKMPYKLPENTFETVQKNVLEKTLVKKEAPIFNLKWFYAAAAVILLIVGFNFFINSNNNVDSDNGSQLAKSTVVDQNSRNLTAASENQSLVQNMASDTNQSVETSDDLTSRKISHLNVKAESQNVATATIVKQNKNSIPTEDKVDDVLDEFSSSEIASLSNNTEQDVYLDLYN
ncbi:hypothetical protein [Halpernia frigidisoli]|uniref:Uncharacterized protein n=1 Tax=Halpernia frigidisoli TaxID=1125876 RepID=A0A1I3H2U9_9FLAO|nr:hypothetical protein [Halpernia frigidisoli]SFI29882.1 hypothetical protein SAMN05443292_2153 [Halpernia frigidisoli]